MSRYPRCCYIIYNNSSEFKLNFEYLCVTYGIKHKPTTIKNPQANAILERLHQVLAQMLRTSELDMAEIVTPDDANVFLDNAAWAIGSTYHTILKAFPGAGIFGRDMLFNIPFIADWKKMEIIGNVKPILARHSEIARKSSRKPIQQTAMDYQDSSYELNYQDSTWNTIRKTSYPQSNPLQYYK